MGTVSSIILQLSIDLAPRGKCVRSAVKLPVEMKHALNALNFSFIFVKVLSNKSGYMHGSLVSHFDIKQLTTSIIPFLS